MVEGKKIIQVRLWIIYDTFFLHEDSLFYTITRHCMISIKYHGAFQLSKNIMKIFSCELSKKMANCLLSLGSLHTVEQRMLRDREKMKKCVAQNIMEICHAIE